MGDERLALAWRCHAADDYARAEALCRQVLGDDPGAIVAWRLLGESCLFQRKYADAAAGFLQALQLGPNPAEVHNNLGVALARQGKLEEAVPHYRLAVQFKPDYVEAYNNLAVALADLGGPDEAEALLRQALRLKSGYAEAHNSLGIALAQQGRLDEAAASYHRALGLRAGYAKAAQNLGIALLLKGDLERGWREYEWRRECEGSPRPPGPQPAWDGAPLEGRTILLLAEQGLGDTIQFIRYAPLVARRGGRVMVACQAALVPLLGDLPGVAAVVARDGPLPAFDVFALLLSLPGLLGTTLATVPAAVPYLHPRADLAARWRARLEAPAGFRVGIAWQGSPAHGQDRSRSFPLAHFAPLASLPGVRLISLQKGQGTEQLRAVAGRFDVEDLGSRLDDDTTGPFLDTAAVMKNLDLVVTSDTSIAHLAGALAVPVWVALASVPDWRWMLGREDSPWYPSMRLFRQGRPGDWAEVTARIARELAQRLADVPRPGADGPSGSHRKTFSSEGL